MEDKLKVLVIDDSPTVRRLAEIVLSQSGYQVYTASDGDEGLEIARDVMPSIILVDFIMPKMNGYKLCKIIRSDPELKDIPLILITAKGEDVGQTFEEKFGVLHYFQKPFEPDDLVKKINEVLGVKEERAEEEKEAEPGMTVLFENMERLFRYYFEHELRVMIKGLIHEVLKETEVVRSKGLILSGELGQVSVADLLQFVSMIGISGRLSVVSNRLSSEIYFEKGNIAFASLSKAGYKRFLTDWMIEDGKITKEDLNESLRESKQRNLPIGRVLVQRGYVSEAELMAYLKEAVEDAIFHTLDVEKGNFYLEDTQIPLSMSDIKFRIPASSVILDGLRKLDESRVAAEVFSDNSAVPVRLITNEEEIEDVVLDEKELRLFSLVDGRSTLGDIIEKSNLDELEVKRILYSLQKINLLRVKQNRR
ncbi:MAG: response regulator [Nitrospirae bacterium]|nr:MAG: response regulator [Nitrospirota bacterium]